MKRIATILAVIMLAGSALGFMTLVQRRRAPAVSGAAPAPLPTGYSNRLWEVKLANADACNNDGFYTNTAFLAVTNFHQPTAGSRPNVTNSWADFDGSSDEIYSFNAFPTGGCYSIRAWCRPDITDLNVVVGFQNDGTANRCGLYVGDAEDGTHWWSRHQSFEIKLYLGVSVDTTNFHCFTVVNDSTGRYLYYDGSIKTNSTTAEAKILMAPYGASPLPTTIGSYPYAAARRFDGGISNVVFFNRGLSSNEVYSDYIETQ